MGSPQSRSELSGPDPNTSSKEGGRTRCFPRMLRHRSVHSTGSSLVAAYMSAIPISITQSTSSSSGAISSLRPDLLDHQHDLAHVEAEEGHRGLVQQRALVDQVHPVVHPEVDLAVPGVDA